MKSFYIIDNNIIYSSGLESMLRTMNCNVLVDHGHYGQEFVMKQIIINQPDFIITDLIFPRFNGISLIHDLQENHETNVVPIAVYTSNSNRYLMPQTFDKGVNHFFIKEDFPPHALLDRIFKIYIKKNR